MNNHNAKISNNFIKKKNISYRCTGAVFLGVLCSLLGVRGRVVTAVDTAGVVVFMPYFFGGTKRLGDCKFLVAVVAGEGLQKKK